jgi:hypothetical protein
MNIFKSIVSNNGIVTQQDLQADVEDRALNNCKAIDRAFKLFAARHGLLPSEVGVIPSRTMDYKTDFPHKKARIAEVRKNYGNPSKWVNKSLREQVNKGYPAQFGSRVKIVPFTY